MIIGGVIVALIFAGVFFVIQLDEVKKELDMQGKLVEDAVKDADFISAKELEKIRYETDVRIQELHDSVERLREKTESIPPKSPQDTGEDMEIIRRDFDARISNLEREVDDINNELRNLRNDINQVRMMR